MEAMASGSGSSGSGSHPVPKSLQQMDIEREALRIKEDELVERLATAMRKEDPAEIEQVCELMSVGWQKTRDFHFSCCHHYHNKW